MNPEQPADASLPQVLGTSLPPPQDRGETAMPEGAEPTLFIILADEVTSGQLHVSLDAFVAFTLAIDASLGELENRWRPFSAPAALRRSPPK